MSLFHYSPTLLVLVFIILAISLLYFYLFSKSKEKYINYWGLSWAMYALSLMFGFLILEFPDSSVFIALKQISDLFNGLFLLFGTYSFISKKIPFYWLQYTLINIMWIATAGYYQLSVLAITLLPSIYLSIIAIAAGINFLKHWNFHGIENKIGGLVFLLWGLQKAYYPYINPQYWDSPQGMLSEIALASILNFCILLVYLQKIRTQLMESEGRIKLLADNAQDMIYSYRLKPEMGFEYVSPASRQILGYDPEFFYRNPSTFHDLTHPEDIPFLKLINESILPPDEPLILRWMHRDGHYIWTEQKNSFIKDKNNRILAIEGIVRDITERKRTEEEMAKAKKERQTLLSYISHELRTPVTSILGYITAMLDGTITEPLAKNNYLEVIQSKSLMLQRLIEDLFQLTQLESKQITFNFSQIKADELAEEITNKYSWEVKNAGLHFKTSVVNSHQFDDAEVIIDLERIHQVFSNLIFNAIKNTPPGGTIQLHSELVDLRERPHLLMKVKDNGNGIREQDLPHVFDRFYKGSQLNPSKKSGSGLGLTIAREIVTAHQGEIQVESQFKAGSTFSVTLPIYQE
ncbi:sensor histidine kinase [Anoxynatronum buryatiense]|uniref:sensor histidine kinase n=1 Tax=Anoxynatronum buryatiense TaxID=489973 RepID=UPI0024B7743D|nr:ATP-binding protein [Anoxynatronum buryatiense]